VADFANAYICPLFHEMAHHIAKLSSQPGRHTDGYKIIGFKVAITVGTRLLLMMRISDCHRLCP